MESDSNSISLHGFCFVAFGLTSVNSISLHGFCFVAFGLTSVYYQLTVMTCCCCIISSSVVESLTTSRVQSCWVFWSYPFFSSELLLIIWLLAFWKIFLFGFGWALLLIFGDCTSFRWNGGGLVWGAEGEHSTSAQSKRGCRGRAHTSAQSKRGCMAAFSS
jgi:hypothetical protein